jgi:hypothetical protein
MYILLKRLRAKKNTKLKMPGPVGRFQKFIEKCFLRKKCFLVYPNLQIGLK